ncbi:hypothetical protein [Chryseobacterium sp. 2987]|uniref:hypothetical protein n=1 Tax=Chryseobacterium sp. 2987 TaxID=2817767 RepID=UPI002860B5B0|nr:hypothetical protein [Chryseobacterium sp. 2987]MDR6919529.1 hypothetical protein [Chryseobacterium sp. 2987]
MDERIILDFNQKLTSERLNDHNNFETELEKLYGEIISGMTTEYSEYRKHVPKFLLSLESNNVDAISYGLRLFFEQYEQLIKIKRFNPSDEGFLNREVGNETFEKMKPIYENSLKVNNQPRLSENNFDISTLSDEDKINMASLIINKLQLDCKQLKWDSDLVHSTLLNFTFLRQILYSLGKAETFYKAVGLFIDRMTSSEFYQPGRDLAEEIILASYNDGLPEAGYFNSFRLYSNTGSIHNALMYANLSLACILKKEPPYSEIFVKEFAWQAIKFFRNVELYPYAIEIYTELPAELSFNAYERRSLDHSYFTMLLMQIDSLLPSKLLDYLRQERKKIFDGGINDAQPWLITLYNVKRLYPTADFSDTGLGHFLNLFETIVPADSVKKYKDIIEANSDDLKAHLMESLVKLNETRHQADFVYDNDIALKISHRLIEYSSKKKDVGGFLLSMMLKSDFSIMFQEKASKELAPLSLPEVDVKTLESLYDDVDGFLDTLALNDGVEMNWLALAEDKAYQLQLLNGIFSFHPLSDWKYNEYNEILDSDYFANLKFVDTLKEAGQIRQVFPEEFAYEEEKMIQKLKFAELSVDNKSKGINIVKDMRLAKFPHNLFLNDKNDFIAKHVPVTNVLSTEWLLQTDNTKKLPADYQKSVWIPIESDDNDLHYLYSNIEDSLQEYSFEIYKNVKLKTPLSADMNIVCSHGTNNISETQIISQEGHQIYDLNTIIGKGKILIFFVCHSGSMKAEFFRNNVTSLIKRFIAQGYEAVIAPFWALDVTIPRYWLPEFLKSFDEGLSISKAVFNANMKVYERYPTPAAWACLHLYGNPNLTKDSTP